MWRLRTLGGLTLEPPGGSVPDAGGPIVGSPDAALQRRPLALLAVLAAAGERGVPRDRLLLYFWPESDTEHARNALKQTLFRLRRDLAAPELVLGASELRLNPAAVGSDVADFEVALAAGELERAIALYRGPFLHGIASGRLPEFDEWAAAERGRLAGRFAAAVESLASAAEARCDQRSAVGWWRRLAAADPTSSRVALGLMTALDAAGDHHAALQYFRLHELLLREELGVAPEESVVALVQRLRDGQRPIGSAQADAGAADPGRAADDGLDDDPHPPATSTSTPTSTPAAHPAPRWNLRIGVPAAVALGAVLVVLVVRARPMVRAGDVEAAPPTIAVLPFAVRAAGAGRAGSADFLREGLVELLSRNLDGAGSLRSADANAVLGLVERSGVSGTSRSALASDVAEQLGASHVVLGDVTAAGSQLRIAATIYDRLTGIDSLRPVGRAEAAGDTAQLFEIVDQLTLRLLAAFPRPPTERLARTAALTTGSLPALRAYLDGEALYREQRWALALQAFERAVREDTAFALAYYRLSVTADWAARHELVVPAAERAYLASGRLGVHDSLLVRAHYAFRRHEAAEAERLYRQVVATWPDDVEAWYRLGELLFHLNAERGRSIVEAREPFARVLRLDPENEEVLLHLLRIAAREGRHTEVDALSRHVLALMPPHRQLETYAFRALTLGTPAEAEEALRALRQGTNVDRYVTAWRVAVFGRKLDAAARVASVMAEPDQETDARVTGHEMRAGILLAQGRRRAADAELAAIAAMRPRYALALRALYAVIPTGERPPGELRQIRAELRRVEVREDGREIVPSSARVDDLDDLLVVTHAVGIVSAALGDTAQALDAARRLTARAERADSVPARTTFARALAASVAAQVAWRSGRPRDALALLRPVGDGQRVTESHLDGLDRFTRAELLRETGRLDEALGWYGSIADISYQNVPFLGVAELRQAQIHDERGAWARALAHYRRVVELWRECDAELRPAAAAARRRIAALERRAG